MATALITRDEAPGSALTFPKWKSSHRTRTHEACCHDRKLKGRIDFTGPDWVMVDVAGVCYFVSCSAKDFGSLPGFGEAAELILTCLCRRTRSGLWVLPRVWKKNGSDCCKPCKVWVRVWRWRSLGVVAGELASAIALQDKAMIGRANGVGKKLAERIVLELKDKAPAYTAADIGLGAIAAELNAPSRQR